MTYTGVNDAILIKIAFNQSLFKELFMLVKNVKFLSILILMIMGLFMTSCNTEEIESEENFTSSLDKDDHKRGRKGKDCFEIVFPVSIKFADETVEEVDSREDMHAIINAWFEANDVEKNRENRPQFVFPITIQKDGEQQVVESEEAFRELKDSCRGGKKGHRKGRLLAGLGDCFDLVYPISINFGGDVVAFDSDDALKDGLKAYFQENGGDGEKPEIVFPIQVVKDGTTSDVSDLEELKELLKDCRGNERHKRCFEPVFPVSFDFDGDVQTFDNKEDLHKALRDYRKENGRNGVRPQPVFPATFVMDSGEEVVVNNLDELKALHEQCED